MSIFSAIAGVFGRKQEVVGGASPGDAQGMITDMITGRTPPRRGTQEFLLAYRTLPWLSAVVRLRANALSQVEWELWRSAPGTVARRLRGMRHHGPGRRQHLERAVDNGRMDQVDRSPLLDLLERPNRSMTGRSLWSLTSKHIDLVGEAFWLVDRGMDGRPCALWPIPPTWVKKTPDARDPSYEVQNYAWRARVAEGDMVWLRDHDVEQPYDRGTGVGLSLQDELETDEYAAKMAKALFFNRSMPSTLVHIEGVQSQAELDKFKAEFNAKHVGINNTGQTHWMTRKFTATPISHTMVESQHLEHRRFQRDFVTQVFRCPPEALGIIENSNRSTIDAAAYFLARYSTEPMADFITTELNAWVVKDFGEDHFLYFNDIVPDDQSRADDLVKAMPWAFTVNEVRERAGYEELEGQDGTVHVVPSGLGQVQNPSMLPPPSATQLPAMGGAPATAQTPLLQQLFASAASIQKDPDWAGAPLVGVDAGKQLVSSLFGQPAPKRVLVLPPATTTRARLTSASIDSVLAAARPEDMWKPLQPIIDDLMREFARTSFAEAARAGRSGAFDVEDPRLQGYLDKLYNDQVVDLINRTTRDQLRFALVEALHNGTSLDAAARLVFASADAERTALIATQMTVVGSEQAKLVGYAQAGVAKREWIATPDGRTRDAHWDLDGEQVPLGQPFVVAAGEFAGASAMEPGGFGIAGLDINCRCTTAPVFTDRMAPADRRLYWRRTETERENWIARLESAVSRGFGAQRRAILAALEEQSNEA